MSTSGNKENLCHLWLHFMWHVDTEPFWHGFIFRRCHRERGPRERGGGGGGGGGADFHSSLWRQGQLQRPRRRHAAELRNCSAATPRASTLQQRTPCTACGRSCTRRRRARNKMWGPRSPAMPTIFLIWCLRRRRPAAERYGSRHISLFRHPGWAQRIKHVGFIMQHAAGAAQARWRDWLSREGEGGRGRRRSHHERLAHQNDSNPLLPLRPGRHSNNQPRKPTHCASSPSPPQQLEMLEWLGTLLHEVPEKLLDRSMTNRPCSKRSAPVRKIPSRRLSGGYYPLHLLDLRKITAPARSRRRACIRMGSSAAQDRMYLCA